MTKYCVLPGQKPVRLASLTGHIIIIGETPREIPEMFITEARAAGCMSEDEITLLKQRLLGVSNAPPAEIPGGTEVDPSSVPPAPPQPPQPPLTNLDSDNDGFAAPSNTPAIDNERSEKIKAAVIELINTGNPTDFTGNGAPKVESLKEKLGFEVTGPERDAAYEAAAKG